MSEGAVWTYRKLLDSSVWTTSCATRCGFWACLLLANYKDQQWYSKAEHKQIVIARGSFFTTWKKFSVIANISEEQTRICFKTLEDLNIITCRATQRGTFITILNYDAYQKMATRRATDRHPDSQRTHNVKTTWLEESKESKEREEGESPPEASLAGYVKSWKRREEWDRKEHAAEIAEGLKKFKLGYRVEEDIYKQIMGEGGTDGTVRSKSISEQVAKRIRQGKLEKPRNEPGPVSPGV